MLYVILISESGQCRKIQVEKDNLTNEDLNNIAGTNLMEVSLNDDIEIQYCMFAEKPYGIGSSFNISATAFCNEDIYGKAVIAKKIEGIILPLRDDLDDDEDIYFLAEIGKNILSNRKISPKGSGNFQ